METTGIEQILDAGLAQGRLDEPCAKRLLAAADRKSVV